MRRLPALLAVLAVATLGVVIATWPGRPDPVEPSPEAGGEGVGPDAMPAPSPADAPDDGSGTGARGRAIEGRVLTTAGAPVEGALVEIDPPGSLRPPSSPAPAPTKSDRDGAFLLHGVPPGPVRVRARHPTHMESEVAVEGDATAVTVRVTPALVAWFRVRPPDGREATDVRVTATSGRFRREQPLSPPGPADPEPPAPGLLGPVKVPADTGAEALFEVRVPGFAPWSVDDDAPGRGAVRVYEVGLVPAPHAGGVRVRLRTETGASVAFARDAVAARLDRLDGAPGPPAAARDADGDVAFDGVVPGRYRVTVLARGRAPAVTEVEVTADEDASAEAAFHAEARARIRVTGNGGKALLLRLTRGDRPVPAFVEAAPGTDVWGPSFTAGEEGVVVGGLGAGEHVVEVIAPDLSAVGARFHARAGETVDVDVRPSPR